VLAAGALERPIAFGNNDGRRDAGWRRSQLHQSLRGCAGKRLAVFTNNDDGWRTAADAQAAGIEIAAVIDSRAVPERFAALGRAGDDRRARVARARQARRGGDRR